MACEFLYNPIQEVALNAPILFNTSIPCSRGYVYHEGDTGNFILKGANSNNACNSCSTSSIVGMMPIRGFVTTTPVCLISSPLT